MSLEQVNSLGTSTPGKEHYTIKEDFSSIQMSQEQFNVHAAHFMNGLTVENAHCRPGIKCRLKWNEDCSLETF